MPSDEWGEDVAAFVVLKPGLKASEAGINTWCLGQMASFKKPKHYSFVADLPKTATARS